VCRVRTVHLSQCRRQRQAEYSKVQGEGVAQKKNRGYSVMPPQAGCHFVLLPSPNQSSHVPPQCPVRPAEAAAASSAPAGRQGTHRKKRHRISSSLRQGRQRRRRQQPGSSRRNLAEKRTECVPGAPRIRRARKRAHRGASAQRARRSCRRTQTHPAEMPANREFHTPVAGNRRRTPVNATAAANQQETQRSS